MAGELLVTYEKGAPKQAKEEAPKKVGGKVRKYFPTIEVQHLSVPEVKNEKAREARQKALELKKVLEQTPGVKAVDYNDVRRGDWVANDTHYGKQWAYPKISAPLAWEATRGHAGIKVAILDSGIDMNHKDLTGKVVHQYDYVKQDNDANDERGHGTHVAGIVAANTDNSLGVAGPCPKCTLINVKVLDSNNQGGGPTGTDDRYIYAIHFAVYY